MSIRVAELHCYPVKSCRGISLSLAEIGRRGIHLDREWMVVDQRGMFVAQRGEGQLGIGIRTMCLVRTALQPTSLELSAPGMPTLSVPLERDPAPAIEVQIWRSRCLGVDEGAEASRWVTGFLSRERPGSYRLVRVASQTRRVAAFDGAELAFADGHPLLVISQSSLDDLNRRLSAPIPMNRFRPNIVLTGNAPYLEDKMARARIGTIEVAGATLCVRCPIPTTDQETGERGKEPLRTLATYRRTGEGVVFGRNFNHVTQGRIAVGDPVEVVEWEFDPQRAR